MQQLGKRKIVSAYDKQQIQVLLFVMGLAILPVTVLTVLPRVLFGEPFLPFPVVGRSAVHLSFSFSSRVVTSASMIWTSDSDTMFGKCRIPVSRSLSLSKTTWSRSSKVV